MKLADHILWIGLIIAMVGGLTTWFVVHQPTASDVQAAVAPLPALPADAIQGSILDSLRALETNGTLPVVGQPANPARTDPFGP